MGFSLKKTWNKVRNVVVPDAYSIGKDLGLVGGSKGKGPTDQGQKKALREGYGAALANEAQSLGSIPKAYAKANTALQSGKGAAIQQAQDVGAQQTANADQNLASRGLYNTTVLDNARQGVAAGVSRQVSDIEARYGQIRAELGLAENAAMNQTRSRIGQLNAGLGGALAGQINHQQALQQQWELSQNPDAWLDSLLGIAGIGIGYSIGGPAGGLAAQQIAGSEVF